MIFTLMTMLMLALNTSGMPYEQARNEALFLTDKMAYELDLTDAQYEATYEINLDYLMSITGYDDVHGIWWERRNSDLRYILYNWQWDAFCAATYFFRPLYWDAGYWHFGVYARYPRRDYFYFGTPRFYASYRGGHSWRSNGGRSFYEHRRDYFRPGHVERSHHAGMRTGWDRGNYRGVSHGNSSTRITAGNRHSSRMNSGRNNGSSYRGNRDNTSTRHENIGTSHSEGTRQTTDKSRTFDSYRSNNGSHSSGSFSGSRSLGSRSSGSFSGSQSSGSYSGSRSSGSFSGSRSSGSYSGSRSSGSYSGSRSSGSYSGSRSSGSYSGSRSSGSFSGSRSSGNYSGSRSSGSYSGSRSSSGNFSGGTRSGGSHGSSREGSSRR